jgi:hypothetical protein
MNSEVIQLIIKQFARILVWGGGLHDVHVAIS